MDGVFGAFLLYCNVRAWVGHMKTTIAALVGLLLVRTIFASSAAAPSDNFPCPVPRGFISVALRSALPAPLQKMFEHAAMPGENFNTTDNGIPGEGLLFVWNKGNLWIVASGHGGIAFFLAVQVFQIAGDGKSASDITPRSDTNLSVPCPLATRYAQSLAQ
jgi:hypothetical protein